MSNLPPEDQQKQSQTKVRSLQEELRLARQEANLARRQLKQQQQQQRPSHTFHRIGPPTQIIVTPNNHQSDALVEEPPLLETNVATCTTCTDGAVLARYLLRQQSIQDASLVLLLSHMTYCSAMDVVVVLMEHILRSEQQQQQAWEWLYQALVLCPEACRKLLSSGNTAESTTQDLRQNTSRVQRKRRFRFSPNNNNNSHSTLLPLEVQCDQIAAPVVQNPLWKPGMISLADETTTTAPNNATARLPTVSSSHVWTELCQLLCKNATAPWNNKEKTTNNSNNSTGSFPVVLRIIRHLLSFVSSPSSSSSSFQEMNNDNVLAWWREQLLWRHCRSSDDDNEDDDDEMEDIQNGTTTNKSSNHTTLWANWHQAVSDLLQGTSRRRLLQPELDTQPVFNSHQPKPNATASNNTTATTTVPDINWMTEALHTLRSFYQNDTVTTDVSGSAATTNSSSHNSWNEQGQNRTRQLLATVLDILDYLSSCPALQNATDNANHSDNRNTASNDPQLDNEELAIACVQFLSAVPLELARAQMPTSNTTPTTFHRACSGVGVAVKLFYQIVVMAPAEQDQNSAVPVDLVVSSSHWPRLEQQLVVWFHSLLRWRVPFAVLVCTEYPELYTSAACLLLNQYTRANSNPLTCTNTTANIQRMLQTQLEEIQIDQQEKQARRSMQAVKDDDAMKQ